jgi:hypothetical protein
LFALVSFRCTFQQREFNDFFSKTHNNMAKQIITASTDTASGLGYFLTKLWAKIKATFYTKTETDTKLDSKQATISGGATTITSSDLTASRALISNSSGKVAVSDVTSTELGYLAGVTSNVQTQLNAKAASSDLDDYLPLAGGTVTGNIVKSSPNVQIGKPFVVVDSTPSSSDVYLFFTINLSTTAWTQDSGYRITYQCRNAGSKFGFINIQTIRASSAASTGLYCGHECLVGNMNAFYYCLENNVVNFYYKQQLPLTIVNVERLSFNELNLAELKSVKLSSLPTNAVLIPERIAWINRGSSSQPIYLNTGIPTVCSTYAGGTKVTLNGTDKGASTASFYAPTSAGTSGQILKSSGGAPSWADADYEPKGTKLAITSDTTLADANVKFVSVTNCTLTLDSSQATEGRVLYVTGDSTNSKVQYKIYASSFSYITVQIPNYKLAVFMANSGSWFSSI